MDEAIILAATDLSARSDRAIDRALMLGGDLGRKVAVVHVVEDAARAGGDPAALQGAVRLALPDPAADIAIIVESGPAPETIAAVARARDAAIIVTGVARFNGLGDYLLGTAVDRLIRHSRRPVLVAKQRPHAPYRRIVCAVDFSAHSGHALRMALRLFPHCRVRALHAYHVAFEGWQKDAYVREEAAATAQRDFDRFLEGLDLPAQDRERLETRVAYGDPAPALRAETEGGDTDLVVLGTHGMGGVRQATMGSTASSLMHGVTPDTLVIPPPE